MAEITMPKLSDTMTEGTLVKWKKKVGDKVEGGEVIAEVETDKATMEMESFEEGTLTEILVEEGQKVEIGQVIARVGEPGDTAPAAKEKPAEKKDGKKPAAPAEVPPDAKAEDRVPEGESPKKVADKAPKPEANASAPAPADTGTNTESPAPSGGRSKASPLAKKLAKERGVNLSSIQGSGPGGRIVQKDVMAAAEGGAPAKAAPSSPPASAPAPLTAPAAPSEKAASAAPAQPTAEGTRRLPLSGMRRAIATRLLESKTRIPHFYLHIEVDAGPLMKLRAELNKMGEAEGTKYSVNDLLLKAVVSALARHPKVNASFDTDAIIEHEGIHLSVAVAVEEGLVTPVIRDARRRTLGEISAAVKDLATRARSKKLKPEEYQGGTFTVSNLGSYGIDQFDAIINPPQAAILSVGRVMKKPVVNDVGEIVVGERLNLGLSCDHRVVDGAIGAEFLATLRKMIETPLAMLAG